MHLCTDIPSLCLFYQQVERAQTSKPSSERYRVKHRSKTVHKIRGGESGSEGIIKKRPEIKADREFKTLKGSFVERESMKAERSEFGMEHEH